MPLKSYDEIARSEGAEQEIDAEWASSMKGIRSRLFQEHGSEHKLHHGNGIVRRRRFRIGVGLRRAFLREYSLEI